jgi:N-methylhydantoinase A
MLLGVDVGGTFTDAALLTSDGELVTAKSPTTPADQSEGAIAAVEAVLERAGAEASSVERFVHGMTVGTNALLEGRVARTALLATEGFTDLEELGRQARAELYRLCAGHPPPLVPAQLRVPVPERTGPDGVLRELDEQELRAGLPRAAESNDDGELEAAAVCLLWGFRHPGHERRCAELLAEVVGRELHVSTSHETAGVFREYERCATTIVDAALSPPTRRYLERLLARAEDAGLPAPEVMLSGGGVVDTGTASRHGSWTVLSGPAGGAVGAAHRARLARAPDAVCLDMGGTSCDVSVTLEGAVSTAGLREVGGRALALPMVDVHTVGAGGGSIAWRDAGGALRVGPRSAGADPGPACYGRGGEQPTVTDANLVLGLLDSDSPLAGGVELDADAAERILEALRRKLGLESVVELAAGIVRVASAEMAQAVRVMTVERGTDPRELALLAFGGAGPLHATAIADELGMRRVVVPRASGVLSALGLIVSERRRDLVESVLLSGDELTRSAVAEVVDRLAERGREELGAGGDRDAGDDGARADHGADAEPEVRASYDLRYSGQAFELAVPGAPEPDPADLRAAFDEAHEERYGYADDEAELELVTVRVAVAQPGSEPRAAAVGRPEPGASRSAHLGGERVEATVHRGAIDRLEGPAIVELPEATLAVPPSWSGAARDDGAIVIERRERDA